MYKITDVVEMGHLHFTGGTFEISFTFDEIVDKDKYLKIIDYLDHSLITDSKESISFIARHFLLTSCENMFGDVLMVLSHFLEPADGVKEITISYGKETFTAVPLRDTKLESFNIEG